MILAACLVYFEAIRLLFLISDFALSLISASSHEGVPTERHPYMTLQLPFMKSSPRHRLRIGWQLRLVPQSCGKHRHPTRTRRGCSGPLLISRENRFWVTEHRAAATGR